jgi:hypothetical protein
VCGENIFSRKAAKAGKGRKEHLRNAAALCAFARESFQKEAALRTFRKTTTATLRN